MSTSRPPRRDLDQRVLLVADLHLDPRQFGWVAEQAGDVDLVVVAGDVLDLASRTPRGRQVDLALDFLRRVRERSPVVACSGNHDLTDRDAAGERAALWMSELADLGVPSDGTSVELGDLFVTICPWWDGPAGQDALGRQLDRASRQVGGRRWLWVHHAPPASTKVSWDGRRDLGDGVLRHLIEFHQPDAVLSGHLHNPPFAAGGSWVDLCGDTWVFNPGQQMGPVPTSVLIDTAGDTASWWSLAGADEMVLDRTDRSGLGRAA